MDSNGRTFFLMKIESPTPWKSQKNVKKVHTSWKSSSRSGKPRKASKASLSGNFPRPVLYITVRYSSSFHIYLSIHSWNNMCYDIIRYNLSCHFRDFPRSPQSWPRYLPGHRQRFCSIPHRVQVAAWSPASSPKQRTLHTTPAVDRINKKCRLILVPSMEHMVSIHIRITYPTIFREKLGRSATQCWVPFWGYVFVSRRVNRYCRLENSLRVDRPVLPTLHGTKSSSPRCMPVSPRNASF